MNKIFLSLVIFAMAPINAHAGIVNDPGLRQVIAKHVAKETAQDAVKVARLARLELARAKRKSPR